MAIWPDSSETQQLLHEARDGDRDAINRLLDKHREALRRMVDLRMDRALARRVDASDIVQDVLAAAHRRLQEYLASPTMPFHLWLRHMAKDRLIDAHRRHRVAERRSVDREQPLVAQGDLDHSTLQLAAQLCDPDLTPASEAAWRELQRRFQAAVETLPEPDREIVLLRNFEQMTNQQAAEALGLTHATASMRYMCAIRKLAALLQDNKPEGS